MRKSTALKLYRFLTDNKIAMRWDGEILSAWIESYNIAEFSKIISTYLSDSRLRCHLGEHGDIHVDLVPVCEWYDIDPLRIFPKSTQ